MKEINNIVHAYDEALKARKQTALATVVKVEGSSYRRPGARMLIEDDGKLTGAISGGCLEGDTLRKAQLVMSQQKPMLVTYDTTDEDDAKLGVQLGCNGIVHILIEPLDTSNVENPVELLKIISKSNKPAVITTLFTLTDRKVDQPGTCMLWTNEQVAISRTSSAFENFVIPDAMEALRKQESTIKSYDLENQLTAFIEFVQPPISLLIFGAGNDALPLVEMANLLGWRITVIDGRSQYATAQRFSLANEVLVLKPPQVLNNITISARTAAILMTHNYNYDLEVLRMLLPLQLAYIGCLGPKKKLQRMLDELTENGFEIKDEWLQSLYGPTGLDVGAETSEEIALSIVAEIKSVFSSTTVIPLRDKILPIHSKI